MTTAGEDALYAHLRSLNHVRLPSGEQVFFRQAEARRDLFADIEGYCDRQRLYSALGSITPEQAERNAG